MSDTEKTSKNNGLKVGLGILAVLFIGALALFIVKNNELNDTKNTLKEEISNIKGDLEALQTEYKEQIASNDDLAEELALEKENLQNALDSLANAEASIETLMRYKSQYFRMKKERDRLFAENAQLKLDKANLTEERDEFKSSLESERAVTDSLSNQIIDKQRVIELGSEISVAGLKGIAIIEKSSGRQMITDKARRADKVKICYVIPANKIAKAGDREYYIQVLDSNNNVLGENAQVQFENKSLNYSLKSTFNYNNKPLDICEYISEPKGGFDKGNYFINVFKGETLISNSSFELK